MASNRRIKVVLIGGEFDLTRMVIENRGHYPLEMATTSDMYVTDRTLVSGIPTEAHCRILHYHRTVKVYGDTWIYEYRPNEQS